MTGRADRPLVPRGRVGVVLLLLVAVAFLIRLDALRHAPAVADLGDAHAYHLLGEGLARGDGFLRPYDLDRFDRRVPTAEYPPALPVVLAAADLAGVDGETGQRVLLCVVGSLTVGLVGLVGRRLGGDAVGLVAAGITAVHPALINIDVSLAAEPLAALLGTATLLAALAAHDGPTARRWLVLGGLLGLGCLVRAEFLLLVPVVLGAVAWAAMDARRDRVRLAALGLVAAVVVLVPWTIRNAVTFHRFVPVSNNLGSVLRGANCDLAYRGSFTGLWVTNVGDDGDRSLDPAGTCFSGFPIRPGVNEAMAATELRSDGLSYARRHLDRVPAVAAIRLVRVVGLYRADQQSGYAALEGRDPDRDRRGTQVALGLLVVGVLGLAAGGWRHHGRLLLLAPVGAVAVTVVLTYGNTRFRSTADPALVLLAAVALGDLWVRLISGRRIVSRSTLSATSDTGG